MHDTTWMHAASDTAAWMETDFINTTCTQPCSITSTQQDNRVKTKTTDREQASPTTRLHESCLVSQIQSSHQLRERAARTRPHHSVPRLQGRWSPRQCKCQYRETLDMSASRDHSLHAARTFRSKWIRARQVHARPPVGRKATNGKDQQHARYREERPATKCSSTHSSWPLAQCLRPSSPLDMFIMHSESACPSCIQTLSFETHRHALMVLVGTKMCKPE